MLDITIDKTKYEMPESWDELSLRKYLEVSQILNNRTEDETDNQIWIKLIQKALNCDNNILLNLSQEDFNILCGHFIWITKDPEKKMPDAIELDINGKKVKYAFKQDSKLNTGERLTTEVILQQYKTLEEQFPYILAVILRPATEILDVETGKLEYQISPISEDFGKIEDRAAMFMDKIMMGEVYGRLVFFSHTEKSYSTKPMDHYSTLKIEKRVKC